MHIICGLFIFVFICGIGALFFSRKGGTIYKPLRDLGINFILGSIVMALVAHLPYILERLI